MDTKYLVLKDAAETYKTRIFILNDLMENTFNILKAETDPKKIEDAGSLLSRTRLEIIHLEKELVSTQEELNMLK